MTTYLDKSASLTPQSRRVICDKATEAPFSGEYTTKKASGTYLCRRCGLALFRGMSQFESGCGWPSFDENIIQCVAQKPDTDGLRMEIICQRCDAHLGHVFTGERLTLKNLRHCVNSLSLDFVENDQVMDTEEAIIAGGCFWGVDYFLRKIPGVIKVEVGYTGGKVEDPTYQQVCQGKTGHYEAVRVVFDKSITNYAAIIKRFFEIHDPTQSAGQGPDIGLQYQSAIFYYNEEQFNDAMGLVQRLQQRGFTVATRLLNAQPFWAAETFHQDYYNKQNKAPYCHQPERRFDL